MGKRMVMIFLARWPSPRCKRFSSPLTGGLADSEVRPSPPGSATAIGLATPTPDPPAPDLDAWVPVERRQRQPSERSKVPHYLCHYLYLRDGQL